MTYSEYLHKLYNFFRNCEKCVNKGHRKVFRKMFLLIRAFYKHTMLKPFSSEPLSYLISCDPPSLELLLPLLYFRVKISSPTTSFHHPNHKANKKTGLGRACTQGGNTIYLPTIAMSPS